MWTSKDINDCLMAQTITPEVVIFNNFGLNENEYKKLKNRTRAIVFARYVHANYLLSNKVHPSEVGARLGLKRCTVLHSKKVIRNLLSTKYPASLYEKVFNSINQMANIPFNECTN